MNTPHTPETPAVYTCDSCGATIAPNDGFGLANNGAWFRRQFVMQATVHACGDACAKQISDPDAPGKQKVGTWPKRFAVVRSNSGRPEFSTDDYEEAKAKATEIALVKFSAFVHDTSKTWNNSVRYIATPHGTPKFVEYENSYGVQDEHGNVSIEEAN